MKYIKKQNRSQTYLFPVSLDDAVNGDNEVRLIDVFVDSLSLDAYGFQIDHGENGRPAYHPGDLLKLYIYGYMNKIRSSRRLEQESKLNFKESLSKGGEYLISMKKNWLKKWYVQILHIPLNMVQLKEKLKQEIPKPKLRITKADILPKYNEKI